MAKQKKVSPPSFPTTQTTGTQGPGRLGEAGDYNPLLQFAQLGRAFYERINKEVAKSRTIEPTNQSQRAAVASRQSMFIQPRNSPSASQHVEGFTTPKQVFGASNTWNTPMGRNSKGQRNSQPSYTLPDLSARNPIRTRMPWDV